MKRFAFTGDAPRNVEIELHRDKIFPSSRCCHLTAAVSDLIR